MNAQQLRAAILQQAIEGKLVPQLDSEPAVEQIGDAPENVPFAIPEKWKWISFEHLLHCEDGKRIPLKKSDRDKLEKIYDYYGATGVIDRVDSFLFDGEFLLIGEDGANLLSKSKDNAFIVRGKFWLNNHAHIFRQGELATLSYVKHFINAISLAPYVTGSAQPKLTQKNLFSIPVSLPPIEEQRRIVAKLEELLPLVEEYGKSQDALDKMNAEIGDKLRASILQEAIQGKLVPQLDEEPAVEQIGEAPEDVPFAIPEKWKWVQSDSLQTLVRGITFPASAKQATLTESTVRCLTTGSVQKTYRSVSDVFVNKSFVKNNKQYLKNGDIVISSANSRELVGKSILWDGEDTEQISFGGFLTVARTQDASVLSPEFLSLIYQYLFVSGFFANLSTQTTNIANVSNKLLNGLAFPLPPLEEQRRIVARVEALLKEVDAIAR